MSTLELYQITLVIALILVVIEMTSGSLLFLGFAIGLLPVAAVHFFTKELAFGRDTGIFAIVSALAFLTLRRYLKHRNDSRMNKGDVSTY